jgi:hypothetical protein
LRDRDQVLGDGALVPDAIVEVGEAEAVDFCDIEVGFEILQAAVEGSDVDGVSLSDQMG